MSIRILASEVVEKIAAGEVVERPASVVKELVENAIDAGSTAISVEIDGGGVARIRVSDDGCGMDAADLSLCLARHATSKISAACELWSVATMGFRGEALASIGAVSRLQIESKRNEPGVVEGARVGMAGGIEEGPVPAGCAAGTTVTISELFFNVPARRKFLKSERVEAGHAVDAVVDLAIAFPGVRFDIKVDGARRFAFAACDPAVRAAQALGEGASLIEVCEEAPGLAVKGFVAERGRGAGRDVHLYVNRRPVRDRTIMHALIAAFGERLPHGRSPSAVLWVEIDPARVDVNVHPTKREVKFASGGEVHSFVLSAVRKALGRTETVVAFDRHSSRAESAGGRPAAFASRATIVQTDAACEIPGVEGPPLMRPLGQLGRAYIVCEEPGGSMVLIDQHAAHERLGFDALVEQHSKGAVAQQRLLIPEQVELGEADAAALVERSDTLAAAGFEIEPFGGGTVVVKAVPGLIGGASVAPLLERLAHELGELGSGASAEEAVHRIFALVACHRQVRAGDALSAPEIANLVRDVERNGVQSCPHGRPALIRIGKEEIEKWFKRT